MKKILVLICILIGYLGFGQDKPENVKNKIFTVISDTIQIDSLSINPNYFKLYNKANEEIESDNYEVDFARSLLFIHSDSVKNLKEIKVEYLPLPEFLTKSYSAFDKNLIVPKVTDNAILYKAKDENRNKYLKPFDGLYTRGSLSRGITVGNNQFAKLMIPRRASSTVSRTTCA